MHANVLYALWIFVRSARLFSIQWWLYSVGLHFSFSFCLLNTIWFILHFCCLYRMDEGRQPLSRKLPIPSSKINPYRLIILLRLVVLGFFFHYRIRHPVNDAYGLWLTSVICEIWFGVSWIFDQFPKWFPIMRETYLDRLSLRYFFSSYFSISTVALGTEV